MAEDVENPTPEPTPQAPPPEPVVAPEAVPDAPAATATEAAAAEPAAADSKPAVDLSKLEQRNRENRGPRPDRGNARPDFRGPKLEAPAREGRDGGGRGPGGDRGPGGRGPGGDRGPRPEGGGRGPGGDRGPDRGRRDEGRRDGRGGPPEGIELEKLIADSLYLDNQAHNVVVRLGLMDSGTKSQLRRLYNAVRRATRAPETERQHEFVMLRARLAYTIARHSLRSLDTIERLLLQVTRKNDAKGYERFRDLFEAIVAYNE